MQDRGLAEGLLAYEDGLCPGCGYPRDKAWDPRSEGEYEAEVHVCQGCAARDRKTKDSGEQAGRFVTVTELGPATSPSSGVADLSGSIGEVAHVRLEA